MLPKYKTMLSRELETKKTSWNLEDVHFSTFVRQMSPKSQMSAADVDCALSGILDCNRSVRKIFDPAGKDTKDKEKEGEEVDSSEISRENFWEAYDLLSFKNTQILDFGVELAKTT